MLQTLALADDSYAGYVNCGTFTHGHVGPDYLPELLRVARPGALFVCGTIAPDFDSMGFGSAQTRLVAACAISPVGFHDKAIYEVADHDHADDRGLVMEVRQIMSARPNILLITADQWRGDCLGLLGHPVVKTPTLDALAAGGRGV